VQRLCGPRLCQQAPGRVSNPLTCRRYADFEAVGTLVPYGQHLRSEGLAAHSAHRGALRGKMHYRSSLIAASCVLAVACVYQRELRTMARGVSRGFRVSFGAMVGPRVEVEIVLEVWRSRFRSIRSALHQCGFHVSEPRPGGPEIVTFTARRVEGYRLGQSWGVRAVAEASQILEASRQAGLNNREFQE